MSSEPGHQVGRIDQDCDEGCCWQYFCTCGALLYDFDPDVESALAAHIAEVADSQAGVVGNQP